MRELTTVLDRLAAGPLPTAESELTSARKAAEAIADGDNAALLARSLTTAGAAQDEVIAQLEQLLGELSGWADFRRFARQLAELRQDQIAHEKTSRSEIGLDTLPLDVRELSRAQRANLNKASAGEDALARRYEKIEQGMDALARQLADKDAAAAGTLADAVDLARRLTIGTNMHETTRDLGENRVGVALERETQIAADLQQVLDVLRNQRRSAGNNWWNNCGRPNSDLAELREQMAALPRANPAGRRAGRGRRPPPTAAAQPAASRVASPDRATRPPTRSPASRRRRPQHPKRRQPTQQPAARRQSKRRQPAAQSEQSSPEGREGPGGGRPPTRPAPPGSGIRRGPRVRPPLPSRAAGDDRAATNGHRRHASSWTKPGSHPRASRPTKRGKLAELAAAERELPAWRRSTAKCSRDWARCGFRSRKRPADSTRPPSCSTSATPARRPNRPSSTRWHASKE